MEELIVLVKEMRRWQKEYFKTKSFHTLEKSREFERKVDKYILDIQNPSLFQ